MKIQALHEFHDPEFSKEWADKHKPTPARKELFATICGQLELFGTDIQLLELGIGPGYLASYLLKRLSKIEYEGLDFSESMLQIASDRNKKHESRIRYTQADLINEDWTLKLKNEPQVVVSTWALHDLFEKKNIASVYNRVYPLLPKGGMLLNGDFIKPETSTFEYEGGRIKPSEHLELLKSAGFETVDCLKEFEINIENPTTANNYACFLAVKS